MTKQRNGKTWSDDQNGSKRRRNPPNKLKEFDTGHEEGHQLSSKRLKCAKVEFGKKAKPGGLQSMMIKGQHSNMQSSEILFDTIVCKTCTFI
jgi:hypothetical protein